MSENGIGHNSAGERIRSFVERVERLEEERAALAEDVKEVLAEAEGVGFSKKVIKTVVKVRKNKRQFEDDLSLVETYMAAMGEQLNFDFNASCVDAMNELMEE
ncbi:MAG: GapR family DNA-binding domain-containing protein [Alphaproteobacteria bacterium]